MENNNLDTEESEKRSSDEIGAVPSAKRRASLANPQRALKACEACRKGKTKCFKSSSVAVRCVRCTSSKLVCSLETEYKVYNPEVRLVDGIPEHLLDSPVENASFPIHFLPKPDHITQQRRLNGNTDEKLNLIFQGVSEILNIMRSPHQNRGLSSQVDNDVKLLLDAANSMKNKNDSFIPLHLTEPVSQDPLNLVMTGARSGFTSSGNAQYSTFDHTEKEKPRNEIKDSRLFASSSRTFSSSPLHVISNSMSEVPQPIAKLLNLSSIEPRVTPVYRAQPDVISLGILTESEAVVLMDDFRSNYGRWVSFPVHVSTKILVSQIRRKSSLLLSTCCSLSLRYSLNGKPSPGDIDSHRRKKDTYRAVIKHLAVDLNKSLLKYAAYQGSRNFGGDVEFLQSMVILSIYSLSLSSIVANTVDPDSILDEDCELQNLNLDSWYLSGLGLSTFISKSAFGTLIERPEPSTNSNESPNMSPPYIAMYNEPTTDHSQLLTLLRIFNHLTLVHLVSCILSGRMCIVDEIRLNQCQSTLSLPSATNFDGRMVSEIALLLITYNFLQINSNLDLSKGLDPLEASLSSVYADIEAWYDEWEYLFKQPALQFGEFCYHFCRLQIVHNYVFHKGKASPGECSPPEASAQAFLEDDSLRSILTYAKDADLTEILFRSYNVTHFVVKVENDSYFAYLSDEIHFFFFYGAMSLVTVVEYLRDAHKMSLFEDAPLGIPGDDKLEYVLAAVAILVGKFETVAQINPNDIITKYKDGIEECLRKLLPRP